MHSLHSRLLLVASLVLASFLGLGALALDRAFRTSGEEAMRERLQGQVYLLLGAAAEDAEGRMRLPDALPDPRLSNPDSGLYAQVTGENGGYVWKSFSLIGRDMAFLSHQGAGVRHFVKKHFNGEEFYLINFGVLWEDFDGRELAYTLAVAESTRGLIAQVEAFRARLMYWLGGAAVLLLVAQGLVLAWGLRPLRKAEADLHRIESGEIDAIGGRFPRELQGLINNINLLIRNGRASRDRYRNSLGDLAHSLKTPLSVLRGAAESGGRERLKLAVEDEVSRMDEIVQYQLRRAAASGAAQPGVSVPVSPLIERLAATLAKVYSEKGVDCRIEVADALRFVGDSGDLMEILGNLMENAFKYGRSQVRVGANIPPDSMGGDSVIRVIIEDDGPGIPVQDREDVLNRGARMDQRIPGQGIGLSVAQEIIQLYGGSLTIGDSNLGGAVVTATL